MPKKTTTRRKKTTRRKATTKRKASTRRSNPSRINGATALSWISKSEAIDLAATSAGAAFDFVSYIDDEDPPAKVRKEMQRYADGLMVACEAYCSIAAGVPLPAKFFTGDFWDCANEPSCVKAKISAYLKQQ